MTDGDVVSSMEDSLQVWCHGVPWNWASSSWSAMMRLCTTRNGRCFWLQCRNSEITGIPSGWGRWSNATTRFGRQRFSGQELSLQVNENRSRFTPMNIGKCWLEDLVGRVNEWNSFILSRRFSKIWWQRRKNKLNSWENSHAEHRDRWKQQQDSSIALKNFNKSRNVKCQWSRKTWWWNARGSVNASCPMKAMGVNLEGQFRHITIIDVERCVSRNKLFRTRLEWTRKFGTMEFENSIGQVVQRVHWMIAGRRSAPVAVTAVSAREEQIWSVREHSTKKCVDGTFQTVHVTHHNKHTSWRSDVPEHPTGGSRSTPTVHPCWLRSGGRGWLNHDHALTQATRDARHAVRTASVQITPTWLWNNGAEHRDGWRPDSVVAEQVQVIRSWHLYMKAHPQPKNRSWDLYQARMLYWGILPSSLRVLSFLLVSGSSPPGFLASSFLVVMSVVLLRIWGFCD